MSSASHRSAGARRALTFIVALGVVSLLADVAYEGARSIIGPFLGTLGASATAVGVVAGLGEFIGYALRLVTGYATDRTKRYWSFTIAGYGINLLAVPLLALAQRWEVAALLVVLERAGKAVRTPARDAMLSHAAQAVGRGWGFGIHEALDQAGALVGPLVVAGVLVWGGGYRLAFAVLLVPALVALAVLTAASRRFPAPHTLESAAPRISTAGLSRAYWRYVVGAALLALGYADFALVAYHFATAELFQPRWIPLLYAMAMAVDAVAALVVGRAFDRAGMPAVIVGVLLSAGFAPLVFLGGARAAIGGMLLWGIGMGIHESTLRATVASVVSPGRRGAAYGIFGAVFGAAWFAGSALMGVLYDWSLVAVVVVSVGAQLLALPVLWQVGALPRGDGSSV